MTQIMGGHNLGLFDGSLTVLNRNDQTGAGSIGQGAQAFANVSNGNLLFQERDIFLPSFGEDFSFLRTYNSRGYVNAGKGWSFSPNVSLRQHTDQLAGGGNATGYSATYGDGTVLEFNYNAGRGLWISTDGAGAYETLTRLNVGGPASGVQYEITRADRSRYLFDNSFALLSVTDANGVATTFDYSAGKMTRIRDDAAHVLTLSYTGNNLTRVTDETGAVLVSYGYNAANQLIQVTDRFGHVTRYRYNAQSLLDQITLPFLQQVNGVTSVYDQRTLSFTYAAYNWNDHPHNPTAFDTGATHVLSELRDALGAVTSFEYDFQFATTMAAGDRDAPFVAGNASKFQGGTTRVVDALGNERAYSNTAEYRAWRTARGYYATYNANATGVARTLQSQQAALIRNAQSVLYTVDANGQITRVTDELGFQTQYTYDASGNLTAITDANGYGVVNSDSAYFRAMRAELGYQDLAGGGKLVAALSAGDKTALLDRFTTRYTHDSAGNLLTSRDHGGNVTTYTYTAFNALRTLTTALGHVTTFDYDAKENLTQRTDGLGNLTRYEYFASGELARKIVYLDRTDLVSASKQQITSYEYDAFGNNTRITDPENNVTIKAYDHFGNLVMSRDPRGAVTTMSYDADNRLLLATDPDGATIRYAYDAVGNQIAVTDASGHTVTRVYSRNNLLLSVIDPSAATPARNRTTQYTYDILGNGTRKADAEGRITTYTYNARRQQIEIRTDLVRNSLEQMVSYRETMAYDGLSNVVSVTDRNGNVTQTLFTVNGQQRRVTDASGNVTEYSYDADLRQISVVVGAQLAPLLRRVLVYGYDSIDQVITEQDALGNVLSRTYDAPGNVVSVTDRNGRTTDFEFDRANRLLRETAPAVTDPVTGLPTRYQITHAYDANGNQVSVTDRNGHQSTMAYDRVNRLVMRTDANGIQTVFSYDSRDNRTQLAIGVSAHLDADSRVVIDNAQLAQVTTFAYDEFSQLVAQTDGVGNALATSNEAVYQRMRTALGYASAVGSLSDADKAALRARYTERWTHDRVGNQITHTDHLGRIETMSYDALDRVITRTEASGTALARTTALRYDGNGNLVRLTDPLGRVTTQQFDARDRLTRITNPAGTVTLREYDNVGNLSAETRAHATADARQTRYEYDLNNRLTRQVAPLGTAETYRYDAVGNRLEVVDARGKSTQYFYDALDRNIRIRDPLTFETRYEYDGAGNRLSIIDARGGITRMEYDAGNRAIQTTDAMGRKTRFEYDALDRTITQITAYQSASSLDQTTRYQYDAQGNLRQVTDALGAVSTRAFDAEYNLTEVSDAKGQVTRYSFDALNRRISITDAMGSRTRVAFDAVDNILSITDALGRTRRYAYDALNQVTIETDGLGQRTTYGYDRVGNAVSITRANGAINRFVFDTNDRLTLETDPLGHTTAYTHDAGGKVLTATDALGRQTTYTYDDAGQVLTITDPLGGLTRYAYDGSGNRVRVTDALGAVITSYFNADNEAELVIDAGGFAMAQTYDANGNVTSRSQYMTALVGAIDPAVRPVLTTDPAQIRTTQYVYDRLNRVIETIDPLAGRAYTAYDAVGNILRSTDANGHTTSFAYNAANRMVRKLTAEGYLSTFEYDDNGRLRVARDYRGTYTPGPGGVVPQPAVDDLSPKLTQSSYDANGRLIRAIDASGLVTTFGYDAVGNQTSMVVNAADSVAPADRRTTTTLYNLANQVIEIRDPIGTVTRFERDAMGNALRQRDGLRYLAGGALDITQERITDSVYDELGRVTRQTDPMGFVTVVTHDAMGKVLSRTSALGRAEARTETMVYDALGRLTSHVNAELEATELTYDAVGNRTSTTALVVTLGVTVRQVLETSTYDKNDRLLTETDGLGVRTDYRRDAVGNLLEMTRAANHSGTGEDRHTVMTYSADNRLLTRQDPMGFTTVFGYDNLGNLVSEQDANGNTVRMAYDQMGRLLRRLSAAGYLTTYRYDNVGNQLESRAYQGVYSLVGGLVPMPLVSDTASVHSATYDANNRVVTETDAVGRVTSYEYDGLGNQTAKIEGSGGTQRRTAFTYDLDNRITEIRDATGAVTRLELDALGNILTRREGLVYTVPTVIDSANERITRYQYDRLDRVTEQTDAVGTITRYTYNAMGDLITRVVGFGLPQARTERFEYDLSGRLTSQVNGALERTRFTYDRVGNRLTTTVAAAEEGQPALAEQRVTVSTYDRDDRLLTETDPSGVRTDYRYDSAGNLLEVTQAANRGAQARQTLMTYSADGRLLTVRDPLGFTTTYTYDYLGNQATVTNALGMVVVNAFDRMGRLLTGTADANGARGGRRITNTYDLFGNVLTTTQAWADGTDARVTTYTYDGMNRQTSVTDGEGFVTRFEYDAFGNQTRILRGDYVGADAAKLAARHLLDTRLTYDGMDRLLTTTDGEGTVVQSVYDALGNRLNQISGLAAAGSGAIANASDLAFAYDATGRVTRRETPTGGLILLAYDQAGNQVSERVLQSGTELAGVWSETTFTYDGNGRVLSSTATQDATHSARTAFEYDAVGNQTAIVYAQGTADERRVEFEFDLNNHLTASIGAMGARIESVYDALGNVTRQTDALGHVTRFYYDSLHRIEGQLNTRGFLTRFTRDSAGNILTTTLSMSAVSGVADGDPIPVPAVNPQAPDRVITSVFDRSSRLTRQTSPDGSYRTYAYDATDKLLTQTQFGAPDRMSITQLQTPRVMTWSYDDSGRLASFVNVDGIAETYAYDAANNKIRETIHNPNPLAGGRVDPDRITVFEYDLDNRLVRQVFDPAGLNIAESLAYDRVGNAVSKTDANGRVSTIAFDLANRVTSVDDGAGSVLRYGYDRVGNLISATDANGYTTLTDYDDANRAIERREPTVGVYRWVAGALTSATVTPTASTLYDATGNIRQITDTRGFVTTRWFDEAGNVIAERTGDGAVRTYSYDALGSLLTVTQDMAFHNEPILLNSPPVLSADVHTITNEYNLLGKVSRTSYSQITVTDVDATNPAAPTSSTRLVTPEELNLYDAFGNLVESVDRNGNRVFAYYDLRGRQVAAIDAAGYLVETDFDDQGNVVQQRKYETPIPAGSRSSAVRPAAPDSSPSVMDRVYDTASRMIEEWSPAVRTAGGDTRVVTRFAYDAAGNVTVKTLGYATITNGVRSAGASPRAEYSFYDAAGRRRAIVGADRVLSTFDFDSNGNLTSQRRYFVTVSAGFNLASATLATVTNAALTGVTPDGSRDEQTDFVYNAANRLISRSDEMDLGTTSDDLVTLSGYDEVGNLTWRTAPGGDVSQTRFNAAGKAVETVSPNGSHSYVEYDTGGLKVRASIGGAAGSSAPQATGPRASVGGASGSALLIAWDQTGAGVTSWVAWDTVSRPGTSVPSADPGVPGSYAHATGGQSAGNGRSVSIATAGSGTVYFRVVSQDAAGNLAWTDEQSVLIPPRPASLVVAESGALFTATVTFDAPVTSAALQTAANADPGSYAVVASNGNRTFVFTFSGAVADQFHLEWVNAGATYATGNVALLAAPGVHADGGSGTVNWPLPTAIGGALVGDGQYVLVDGVLRTDPSIMGAIDGVAVSAVTSTRINSQLNVVPGTAASSTSSYDALYGNLAAQTHSASIAFTQTQTGTLGAETGSGTGIYNVSWANGPLQTLVSVTLSAAEAALVSGGSMRVGWRTPQDGVGGFTSVAAGVAGSVFSATLTALSAASTHDIKVWYTDASGREVIVEWRRVTVPANALSGASTQTGNAAPGSRSQLLATRAYTGDRSLTVLASETGGTITRDSGTALSVVSGTYIGPRDASVTSIVLVLQATGSIGGEQQANGQLSQTYFTEITYNALGSRIASNEDTGVWRTYGVDATGNIVQANLFGTRADQIAYELSPSAATAPIVSYKTYDGRNLETASIGALVTAGRAITQTVYDYAARAVRVVDPGNTLANARQMAYDDAGNLISETDAEGHVSSMVYNAFGQLVARTDANGHTQRKAYDASGLLVTESTDGVNDLRTYVNDAFGRRLQVRAYGNRLISTYTYDQKDRLTSVTDGAGGVTRYYYDVLGNPIWVQDASGRWFGSQYDSMGQVTHRYSFQSRFTDAAGTLQSVALLPTTLAQAQAAVASAASPYRAALRDQVTRYDLFNNKRSEIDAAGREQTFSYGAFGRLSTSSTQGDPKVISYTYDRFGNKTAETSTADSQGRQKDIVYTHDLRGQLLSIDDRTTDTTTTYTLDVAGRRVTERLAIGAVPATEHDYRYTYDHGGALTTWLDVTSQIRAAYQYDGAGNVSQVLARTGYLSAGSPGTELFTHNYTYDAANRVLTGAGNTYTYDNDGRRATRTGSDGVTVTYAYDQSDRVVSAATASAGTVRWTYDKVGNLTSVQDGNVVFSTDATTGAATGVASGTATNYTYYTYDANNVSYTTVSSDSSGVTTTTTDTDKSGRLIRTGVLNPDGTAITYTNSYNADGTEASVTGSTGEATGSSSSTYDVNGRLTRIDLGKGDSQDHNQVNEFTYDNQGHIVRANRDSGASGATFVATRYLYANDQAVGEYTDTATPTLDSGNYSVIKSPVGAWGTEAPDFPASAIAAHVVTEGETLQSIAGQAYGHPELWYVIADANGLTGAERLQPGQRLTLPNSVQYAGQTAQTHALYKEGDIVGSKMPNLLSPPPPPPDKCAVIAAIILVVVVAIVAVVVTVLTVGAAAPAAAAALGVTATSVAGIIVGVAVGAVIGAAVAFAASAITQGILIGFKLQEKFDWNQVAADVAAGAFSGAAAGLGAMVETLATVGRLAKLGNAVGQAALEVSGELARQAIVNNGHIDNWTNVAIAGGGGALGALASTGLRSAKKSEKVVAETLELTELSQLVTKDKLLKSIDAAEIGDTLFKNADFKFKVVEADDGAMIVKRFERMSALKTNLPPPKSWFHQAPDMATFRSVFKQRMLDQTMSVRTSWRSLTEGFDELGAKLTGKLKSEVALGDETLKFTNKFVTSVDPTTGVRTREIVRSTNPVLRARYAQTTLGDKIAQTFKTLKLGPLGLNESRVTRVVSADEYRKVTTEMLSSELGVVTRDVVHQGSEFRLTQTMETFVDTKKVTGGVVNFVSERPVNTGANRAYLRQADDTQRLLRMAPDGKITYHLPSEATRLGLKENNAAGGFAKLVNMADNIDARTPVDILRAEREATRLGRFSNAVGRLLDLPASEVSQLAFDLSEGAGDAARAIGGLAVDAKNAVVAGAKEGAANARTALREFHAEADYSLLSFKGLKLGRTIGVKHGLIAVAIDRISRNDYSMSFSDSEKEAMSGYSTGYRSAFRFSAPGGAASMAFVTGMSVYRAYANTRKLANGQVAAADAQRTAQANAAAGRARLFAHPERDAGKMDYVNRDAAATFRSSHQGVHAWAPTDWVNTAAGAATQIFSALNIDRAVSLATTLKSNRLIAGESAAFTSRAVVDLALGTVGRVQTNPMPMPTQLLDNLAPNPRA